jgi:hypothetical protein
VRAPPHPVGHCVQQRLVGLVDRHRLHLDRDGAAPLRVDRDLQLEVGERRVMRPAAERPVVRVRDLELVDRPVTEVVRVLPVVVEQRIQRASGPGPPSGEVGVDPHRQDRRLAAPAQHLGHQRPPAAVHRVVDDAPLRRRAVAGVVVAVVAPPAPEVAARVRRPSRLLRGPQRVARHHLEDQLHLGRQSRVAHPRPFEPSGLLPSTRPPRGGARQGRVSLRAAKVQFGFATRSRACPLPPAPTASASLQTSELRREGRHS